MGAPFLNRSGSVAGRAVGLVDRLHVQGKRPPSVHAARAARSGTAAGPLHAADTTDRAARAPGEQVVFG